MPPVTPDPILSVPQQPTDLVSFAVALGRVEEKLNALGQNESRRDDRMERLESGLLEVKTEITTMKAQQKPRTPWWAVWGGIAALTSVLGGGWLFLQFAIQVASKLP